ncbi:MAG: nickel-type superoxide dismutase maturation protease [Planctomycetota bacterium]
MRRANSKDFILWLFGRRRRFRVEGRSMLPTLQPADHLLVNPRAYRGQAPSAGDIVIALHPLEERELVKRIERVENGRVWLLSDNPLEGMDSRSFGPINLDSVRGQVLCKLGAAH